MEPVTVGERHDIDKDACGKSTRGTQSNNLRNGILKFRSAISEVQYQKCNISSAISEVQEHLRSSRPSLMARIVRVRVRVRN